MEKICDENLNLNAIRCFSVFCFHDVHGLYSYFTAVIKIAAIHLVAHNFRLLDASVGHFTAKSNTSYPG